MQPSTVMITSSLLVIGLVFAAPFALAFGVGVDAAHVDALVAAGKTPQYGQTWVGKWMQSSGWSAFTNELTSMRDHGVTPVIMWYYWGDSISPSCVQYGCNGLSKSEWDSMARDLATRAAQIMGGRTYYIVLEPEFNKNGIQSWETFDGDLAAQAATFRSLAPSAKLVVGFGHWGGWSIFDRAVAASDMVGFQILRGSTRDSTSTALGTADFMVSVAQQLTNLWHKPVMVFDVGIATYGGWESIQQQVLKDIAAKRSALDGAGIKAIVWRYLLDNNYSSGYFGPAESSWGVEYANGAHKPGYDALMALMGSSGFGTYTPVYSAPTYTMPTYTAPTYTAPTYSTFSASFSGIQLYNWWTQVSVSSTSGIAHVEVSVNGGAWQPLSHQTWGAWAASINVPSGGHAQFRATSFTGQASTSSTYWK